MTLSCGRDYCPEHKHCAYHGDEPDRCPWCHKLWTAIEQSTYGHCCEKPSMWHISEREQRVSTARAFRLARQGRSVPPESDSLVVVSGHCPHREESLIDAL